MRLHYFILDALQSAQFFERSLSLTWKYENAPAGRYELYLETSEGQSRTFPFEHDPNWF